VRRTGWIVLAILLRSGLVRATGLDDLRSALEKLRAREPVRVRITQENKGEFDDDGQKRTRQGRATIVAEDGGTGQPLRLVYDDAMLTQAAREQVGRRDSKGPGDAVRDLDALKVLDLLRPAEKLLEDLAGAQLVSERVDGGAGGAARVLELTLRAPKGIDQEKGFKVARTAKIWIDGGGFPLTSEVQTHTEVRRLVFKVRFDITEKNTFAAVGHRLVVRNRETENRWKASIFAEGSNRSATTVEVVE